MAKKSFNNKCYIKIQSEKILERVSQFENKLYLEFGGKLFDDYHASRVLRGFEIDSKVKVLSKLKDKLEILIVVSAEDIQANKARSDVGITYESDVLRLIDYFNNNKLLVGSVVITKYNNQPQANIFRTQLSNLGIKSYLHYNIENYPYDINKALSDEGFGKNDYVETTKPIVVVTAPGPGSGKMATCLSQLYHDNIRGIKSGYAKYETFPVWNLPLKHPVNLAYEAATTNLNDVNMIDYHHLEAYGVNSTSYNRDLEVFPILKHAFENIYGESPYKSPTDMGVNMLGYAITDDEAACESSKQEIIRRFLDAKCANKLGKLPSTCIDKLMLLMNQLNITVNDRKCVGACLEKASSCDVPCVALELSNGKIITGKRSDLFEATSAAIINALKYYAKIPDDLLLLSISVITPIQNLKKNYLNKDFQRLTLDEVLFALAITAQNNTMAEKALLQIPKLASAQMHSSIMLPSDEVSVLKKLKIDVTTETSQDTLLLN